jgi:serine/threonine-protein kinase
VRFEKYGQDVEAGLSEIVRKALRKSPEDRWQTAAAFRDALAEWLYDHRHRVNNKHIADVVVELRDAVVERRNRAAKVPDAAMVDELAIGRAPSDNDAPIITVENDLPSGPNISVSFESEAAKRAAPISELSLSPSDRIETIPARSAASSDVRAVRHLSTADRLQLTMSPEERGRLRTTEGMPPLRPPSGSTPPIRGSEGVIEVPIADTISAAVEAITLPDPDTDMLMMTETSEDSAMRAFDDLTEPPPPRFGNVRPPTAEEALRKKPPTPPAMADIAEPPDDAGEFSTTSPLRVLFRLMTARATGLLVVAVGGIKKEIYVRDGQPEYVSSNVANELFGNYLVTKGVLSDGELAMALAMMPHYGGKLGDTLVGLGLLKPLEVFRHLTRQVRTKIIDVCTWNKGSFGWYAGRENPREAFPLDFNAFEILGAGAMALSDDHIETWIAKYGSLRLRASRTRRVGPERFEVKGLVELCDLLDGKRSVADLVELHTDRADRLRVGRMLCLLESCDLARPS